MLFLLPGNGSAATYTVCASGCNYTTINGALPVSVSGDTIIVYDGTYSESIDYGSKNIIIQSLNGAATTTIQGTAGNNSPVINFNNAALTDQAVLDGFTINNQGTNCNSRGIYIGSGAAPKIKNSILVGNTPGCSYNGAAIYITGGGATIDSVTIGVSGTPNTGNYGAGVYATGAGSALTISNSTISYNTGVQGGAVYLTSKSVATTITNTTITNHSTTQAGAGIFTNGSPLNIINSTVSNNVNSTAGQNGGGLYMTGAAATVTVSNTAFTGNRSDSAGGGGIYAAGDSDLTMTGGSVSGGRATSTSGGGIYATGAGTTVNLSKVTVSGNRAAQYGAGIYMNSSSAVTLTNCIVSGNSADGYSYSDGGGILNTGATLTIMNATIAGNYTTRNGGGLNGAGTVTNGIFWGNTAGTSGPQIYGAPTVTYSDVSGGYAGTGNINADPLFVTPAAATSGNPTTAGDFHIQATSQAMNVGTATGAPADDIDGHVRPQGAGYDMGADEYLLSVLTTTAGTATATGASETTISVSMPYTDDGNANNTYTVDYKLSSSGTWTNWVTNAAHTASPYATTITGLTPGETYDVRMTYNDADGVTGTNPQTVNNITAPQPVTTAGAAAATAAGSSSIGVSMPYTDDSNANNTYTVDYKLSSSGTWTNWVTNAAHAASPYATTVTGLTQGASYDVRMIYNDADGVNGTNPQTVTGIVLPYDSTTAGTATAASGASNSIGVSMPYTNDGNANNTYTVDYKLSSSGTWTNWVTNAAHTASPYAATITGLTQGETYDVRMTYNDADGVNGTNPQTVSGILIPVVPRLVPSQYSTIQAAIDASINGDIIQVSDGSYPENINFNSKNVKVQSVNGSAYTSIVGGSNAPVVTFNSASLTSTTVLNGFKIDNSAATNTLTRGIYIAGSAAPTIKNCKVEGNNINSTIDGSGVYINGGSAAIQDSSLGGNASNQNTCRYGCGLYATALSAPLTISNTTISENSGVQGAGVYLLSNGSQTTTISGATIVNNITTQSGGAIYNNASKLTISGGSVNSNSTGANMHGGGIYATGATAGVTISSTTFSGNSSGNYGGAVYITGSTEASPLTITNSTFSGNTTTFYGGAIAVISLTNAAVITGSTITGNTAGQRGGGITVNGSPLTITDSIMDGNTATSFEGGAIYFSGGSATITGGSMNSNNALQAAAMYVGGGATVSYTGGTINGNTASGNLAGGIWTSSSTLNLTRVYLSGNRSRRGGGMYADGTSVVTLTNCNVTGNAADSQTWSDGGGLYNNASAFYIYSSTVAGNYATDTGGGLKDLSGTATIKNSIIWGNVAATGPQVYGTPASVTFSDVDGVSDPLFVHIVQAGEGTPTTAGDYHIQVGSPEIDTGTATGAPADDLDGESRPNGSVDIGADEYWVTTPPGNVSNFTVTNPGSGNTLTLSWSNPYDIDFAGVKVVRADGGTAPSNCSSGTLVYDGTGTSYSDTGLTDGAQYSYRICSYDGVPAYSSGVTGSGTPSDTAAPADVTGFTAIAGNTLVSLTWTNPTTLDYAGTKILRKEGSYPSSCTDGTATQLYSGTGTSHFDTGLTNGTAYYYMACTFDEAPNYSAGSTATSTPYLDLTPPGEVSGFGVINAMTGGKLNLTWSKPADVDLMGIKIVRGTGATAPADCSTGTVVYNSNGTDYADTGLTDGTQYSYRACAYDISGNYSAGVTGTNTPLDITPPANVTDLTVTPGAAQITLSWTNPADSDFAGVRVARRTDAFPTSCIDSLSTAVYTGTGTGYVDTGLTNGITYYYLICTYDEVPNYSGGVQKSSISGVDTTPPGAVSDLAQGSYIYTRGAHLTWTAPGNDGGTGTAVSYDFRFTDAIDYPSGVTPALLDSNWSSLTQTSGEPTPKVAGSAESFTVTGDTLGVYLKPNTQYYFVMKTSDDSGNTSGISNVAQVHTALKYGFNTVSVPYKKSTGGSNTIDGMLNDDVSYVYMFTWQSTGLDSGAAFSGNWVEVDAYAAIPTLSDGQGYYLYAYSMNSSIMDEKNSAGTPLVTENTDAWARIDLVLGRNLIGNPYLKNVSFSNIKICKNSTGFSASTGCTGGTVVSFQQAVTNGWMDGNIAYYANSTTYTYETCNGISCNAQMRPWWGQWVYLLDGVDTYILAAPKP